MYWLEEGGTFIVYSKVKFELKNALIIQKEADIP